MPAWPRLAELGYRWPAEWEPHRATWLAWPHNPETWPGRLGQVEEAFVAMVRALVGRETVCINVCDEAMEARVRRRLGAGGVEPAQGIEFHHIPSDDAWIRDHGPFVVVRDAEAGTERALLDFAFNAWGCKYEPYDQDDAVPQRMARVLALPIHRVDLVLEGGSVDGNGAGVVLTTETCLLHPNRGMGRSREILERLLRDTLGARQVVWLAGEVAGDDTDGHVDDLARFVAPTTVVAASEPDPSDVNHAALVRNLAHLRRTTTARGSRFEVVPLPMPPPVVVDGVRCPASYANFYLANRVALVPVFGVAEDARALAVLREVLPGRDVVGIPARDLVVGLGGVHCLTQQESAGRGGEVGPHGFGSQAGGVGDAGPAPHRGPSRSRSLATPRPRALPRLQRARFPHGIR